MIIHSLVLAGLFLTAAASEPDGGTAEQRNACRADVRKYCFNLPKDSGAMDYERCLAAHHDKLSEPCRIVIDGK